MYNELLKTILQYVDKLMQDHIILYFTLSVLWYLLGGIDDPLMTLIVLHLIKVISCFICKKDLEVNSVVKIYVVIVLGNILDNVFKLDSTSLRMYLIIYYTYNTMVDILNTLSEDKRFPIPNQLKKVLEKMKKE